MLRKVLTGLMVCLIFAPMVVLAQTASPTPTATSTPPPTPDVSLYWTLPPPASTGTPSPGQDVLFYYSADTGDVAIALFVGALIVLLWGLFLLFVYLSRGRL